MCLPSNWKWGTVSLFYVSRNLSKSTPLAQIVTWCNSSRISGRSFNTIHQYPVMPWVLSDYSSATLDLNDPQVCPIKLKLIPNIPYPSLQQVMYCFTLQSYRDLSKPIAAISEERRAAASVKYQRLALYWLSQVFCNVTPCSLLESNDTPYMHGSHYSNVGVPIYFLVRLGVVTGYDKMFGFIFLLHRFVQHILSVSSGSIFNSLPRYDLSFVAPFTNYHVAFQSGLLPPSTKMRQMFPTFSLIGE